MKKVWIALLIAIAWTAVASAGGLIPDEYPKFDSARIFNKIQMIADSLGVCGEIFYGGVGSTDPDSLYAITCDTRDTINLMAAGGAGADSAQVAGWIGDSTANYRRNALLLAFPSYRFDASTTKGNPGSGDIRFDNATPASVTALYINDATIVGEAALSFWNVVDTGYIITIQGASDPIVDASQYRVTATGDSSNWWHFTVTTLGSGTLPSASDTLYLTVLARDVRTGVWLDEGEIMAVVRDTLSDAIGMNDRDILNVNVLNADTVATDALVGGSTDSLIVYFSPTTDTSRYMYIKGGGANGDTLIWVLDDKTQYVLGPHAAGAGSDDQDIYIDGTLGTDTVDIVAGSGISVTKSAGGGYDSATLALTTLTSDWDVGDARVTAESFVAESLLVGADGDTVLMYVSTSGSQTGQLVFRDSVSGEKTLAQLAAGGGELNQSLGFLTYRFDAGTSDADPGSGNIAFNSGTPGSVSKLWVDDNSIYGFLAEANIAVLDTGYVVSLNHSSAPSTGASIYRVDSIADRTGYWMIGVTHLGSAVIPSALDTLMMTIVARDVRTGGGGGNDSAAILHDATDTTHVASWVGDTLMLEDTTVAGAEVVIASPDADLIVLATVIGDTTTITDAFNMAVTLYLKIDTGATNYYSPFYTQIGQEPGEDWVWAWNGTANRWEAQAQTGGSGEATSAINLANANAYGWFYQESVDELQFRSLQTGHGAQVVDTSSNDSTYVIEVDTTIQAFRKALARAGGTMTGRIRDLVIDSPTTGRYTAITFVDTADATHYFRWDAEGPKFQLEERLWIDGVLEVTGTIVGSGIIQAQGAYVSLNSDGPDGDSYLGFYKGSANGRTLLWNNTADRFEMNDVLLVENALLITDTGATTGSEALQVIFRDSAVQTHTLGFSQRLQRFELSKELVVTGRVITDTVQSPLVASRPIYLISDTTNVKYLDARDDISSIENLYLNADSSAVDVAVFFAQTGVDPELRYSNSNARFQFNENVFVTGTLESSLRVTAESHAAESLIVGATGDTVLMYVSTSGSQTGQLVFRDSVSGEKTLAELVAGAGGFSRLKESTGAYVTDSMVFLGLNDISSSQGTGGNVDTIYMDHTDADHDYSGDFRPSTVLLAFPSYRFDATTTKEDPGSGDIRFDNATPASVTAIYVDDGTIAGELATAFWGVVDTGYVLSIQGASDPLADASQYRITAVGDSSGWTHLEVTTISSGTLPTASDTLYLTLLARDVRTGGSPTDNVYDFGTHADNEIPRYHTVGGDGADSIQAGATNNPTISDAGVLTANEGVASTGTITAGAYNDTTADGEFRVVLNNKEGLMVGDSVATDSAFYAKRITTDSINTGEGWIAKFDGTGLSIAGGVLNASGGGTFADTALYLAQIQNGDTTLSIQSDTLMMVWGGTLDDTLRIFNQSDDNIWIDVSSNAYLVISPDTVAWPIGRVNNFSTSYFAVVSGDMTITNNAITEPKISESVGSPSDNDLLTYNLAGTNFTWETPTGTGSVLRTSGGESLVGDSLDEYSATMWLMEPIQYAFSTTTTDGDPGAGVFRYNNATQGISTEIFADDLNMLGEGVDTLVSMIDNGFYLRLQKIRDDAVYHIWPITAVTVNASGYSKIQLGAQADGAGSFSANDTVIFQVMSFPNLVIGDSVAALRDGDVWTGVHDFGGATSLEIPQSALPNPTDIGHLFMDNDDYALVGTDGTDDHVIAQRMKWAQINVDDPENLEADTVVILWVREGPFPAGIIIDSVYFMQEDASSYTVVFREGTDMNSGLTTIETLTASAEQAANGSAIDNPTIETGNVVMAVIPTTARTKVTVGIAFHIPPFN